MLHQIDFHLIIKLPVVLSHQNGREREEKNNSLHHSMEIIYGCQNVTAAVRAGLSCLLFERPPAESPWKSENEAWFILRHEFSFQWIDNLRSMRIISSLSSRFFFRFGWRFFFSQSIGRSKWISRCARGVAEESVGPFEKVERARQVKVAKSCCLLQIKEWKNKQLASTASDLMVDFFVYPIRGYEFKMERAKKLPPRSYITVRLCTVKR